MYDKVKRRIVRLTRDPHETVSKMEVMAAMLGCSVEQLAAAMLDVVVEQVWHDLAGDDDLFQIDCLCCADDRDQVEGLQRG